METAEYLSELIRNLTESEFLLLRNHSFEGKRKEAKGMIKRILNALYNNREELFAVRLTKMLSLFKGAKSNRIQYLKNYINDYIIFEVECFVAQIELKEDKLQVLNLVKKFGQRKSSVVISQKSDNKYQHSVKTLPDSAQKSLLQHRKGYDDYLKTTTDKYRIKSEQLLQESLIHLNDFYLINQLQLTCEIISREKLLGSSLPQTITKELLTIAQNRSSKNKMLNAYFQIYLMLTEEKGLPPEEVIPFYKEHITFIPRNRQLDFLFYLINYINTFIITTALIEHKLILHELHKLRVQPFLINLHPIFNKNVFISIVQLGSVLDSQAPQVDKNYYINWTDSFIKKYKNHLTIADREKTETFTKAIVSLYKQNYTEAKEQFEKSYKHFSKAPMKLRSLTYMSICIVENEILPIQNKKEWYVHELKTVCHKIKAQSGHLASSQETHPSYYNFADILQQLMSKISVNYDKIEQQINNTIYLSSRNWLTKTTQKLKKREENTSSTPF
jgi:hypothetical protein